MIIQIDLEQKQLEKFQNIADDWNISISDLLIQSTNEKIDNNKLIYERLTQGISESSKEESDEIIKTLNSLSEDDRQISSVEMISLWG